MPSLTTPLGLVAHATFVEQVWFHHRVAGVSREQVGIPETVDESFILAPEDTVVEVRRRYLDACDRSRDIAAEHGLDEVFDWRGAPVSLRFLYAHLLTELARPCRPRRDPGRAAAGPPRSGRTRRLNGDRRPVTLRRDVRDRPGGGRRDGATALK